jgi:hypothetical protein
VGRKRIIQGVSEIGALILTGNRTRQKEQLFYLPFCRKTMFNSEKTLERFFTKTFLAKITERKVVPFDEFYYQLKLMHLFQKHPVFLFLMQTLFKNVSLLRY